MAENFDFEIWAEENDLSRESIKALRSQKMTDHTCLTHIKSGEVKRAGLALGQEVLFRLALTKLGNPNFQENAEPASLPGTPRNNGPAQDSVEVIPDEDPLLLAGAQLDALFKDSPDMTRPTPSKPSPMNALYDPRILLSARATTKKAEKIVAYLPEKVKDRIQRARRDRMVFTQAEDGSIAVKNNEGEPYHITMSEWGAANMRLMNHLLQTGDLPRDQVEYYMAYTMQIFELSDSYEWASVLLFDNRYRELQAEHGFVWGDMRLALQMQVLTPRINNNAKLRNSRQSGKVEEDCKKWLATGGKCPFGHKCRYVHRKLDAPAKND